MTDTLHVDPTPERIAQAGDRFVGREITQTTAQRAGRITSWYDQMRRQRGGQEPILTAEMAMAAADIDMYWHAVHDERGITSSYGNHGWSGTPMSQLSQERLLGPEWRETCRIKFSKARMALGDERLWDALLTVIERDGTAADAGRALGYADRKQASAAGVVALRAALQRLAVHFGYSKID